LYSFQELSEIFAEKFRQQHFPAEPAGLYEPAEYFLGIGGKRIRPIACLMGNELFNRIKKPTWDIAYALELFHNFTLMHDDIMDNSPLRRGKPTVHERYGVNTAILSGDIMLIRAYEYLGNVNTKHLPVLLELFNKTAKEVCEGQQLDMDFEKEAHILMDDYIRMITLKTSALLAASFTMGAIAAGASKNDCEHIYEYGKNLGIAFQIQDDYLDCFGNPEKIGKETGGDIRRNKKTFLLIKAQDEAVGEQKIKLTRLLAGNTDDKIEKIIAIYKSCGVDKWAKELWQIYANKALRHLNDIIVADVRKRNLRNLTDYLLQREY
jgi:geranylgeranyl diphosphate synthase type II